MRLLIPALFFDITRRCNLLEQRLAQAAARAPSVRYQARLGEKKAQHLRDEAQFWLEQATELSSQEFNSVGGEALADFIREYERLSGDVGYYERFLLTPVEHFHPRLTSLCRALLKEVNWPLEGSLVGAYADSEDGSYWTVAPLRVIGAPVGEAACLLGLPDLCHELGHHLVDARIEDLKGSFDRRFAEHKERLLELLGPRRKEFEPRYRTLVKTWTGRWLQELISDVVATYVVGPSFGWQHMRLCLGNPRIDLSDEFAELARESHPHDDVRMFAITRALRAMDADGEAGELDRVWDQYMETVGLLKMRDNTLLYPTDVVLGLVDSAIDGCAGMKVRRFERAGQQSEMSIVALMAEAWREFRTNPAGYTAWEHDSLSRVGKWLDAST